MQRRERMNAVRVKRRGMIAERRMLDNILRSRR